MHLRTFTLYSPISNRPMLEMETWIITVKTNSAEKTSRSKKWCLTQAVKRTDSQQHGELIIVSRVIMLTFECSRVLR